MNPHEETTENGNEDQFFAELEAYEVHLTSGPASPLSTESVREHWRDDVEQFQSVLRLLNRVGGRSPPASPTEAPNRLARFELRRQLGAGGFGIVYLAFDPLLRREIALKIPRTGSLSGAETRDRFLREALAAATLNHPGIVPVHEAGEDGWWCYLVSAYCRGPNLAAWLKARQEPVPPDEAARIIARLADAVQHAHDRGILHRDLKPSNVLLEPLDPDDLAIIERGGLGFVPKLTDFGLAKIHQDDLEATRSGILMGTASYMRPSRRGGSPT